MGKQCRRGKVIMSPGHKWDNSAYYNHTGECHSATPCILPVRAFLWRSLPVTGHASRQAVAEHTARSHRGKESRTPCPQDAAGLAVLNTDKQFTPAHAMLYTSLLHTQEAAVVLPTTPILLPSSWWPTTHMPTLPDLLWCTSALTGVMS